MPSSFLLEPEYRLKTVHYRANRFWVDHLVKHGQCASGLFLLFNLIFGQVVSYRDQTCRNTQKSRVQGRFLNCIYSMVSLLSGRMYEVWCSSQSVEHMLANNTANSYAIRRLLQLRIIKTNPPIRAPNTKRLFPAVVEAEAGSVAMESTKHGAPRQ